MKVVTSIRDIYNDREPIYQKLKSEVDDFFTSEKLPKWHYESRVKRLQSFSLKAETARFEKISDLEDFFGACLVVENSAAIENAIQVIKKKFKIVSQKPKSDGITHKQPDSFVFDDLRLYLEIPSNPNRRPKGIEGITFELQLKTFLQHAWAIATHDLIYKGDELSWASNRIAYQVKAMLEHAELSIMESQRLSESELLKKTSNSFEMNNKLMLFFKETWSKDLLPNDLIRLTGSIRNLMRITGIDFDELREICRNSKHIGDSPRKNISPNAAITIATLEARPGVINKLRKKQKRVFIPDEAFELLEEELQAQVDKIRIRAE